jgi:hypothetical protein
MKLKEMAGGSALDRVQRRAAELLSSDVPDPEEFYQDVVIPSGVFEQAYGLFPKYNNRQSLDASDWIMRQIEDGLDLESNPRWEAIRDEVYDKVVAGLT